MRVLKNPKTNEADRERGYDNDFLFFQTVFEDVGGLLAEEKGIPILYRFDYCPPYTAPKDFRGIKDLQLQVQRKNVFCQDCRIFLDVTEWLGHEQEELFQVTMKYLHDKTGDWSYTFIVRSEEEEKIQRMYLAIRCYMKGTLEMDKRCRDKRHLQKYLENTWLFDEEAAAFMASFLFESRVRQVRSDTFLRAVVAEIQGKEHWRIQKKDLLESLKDPDSILGMVAGCDWVRGLEEKGGEHGGTRV